jgi:shikimate kinase/3-dehydroquinate synthase
VNHVFLTGFMGAGKSSVGRLLAASLGRPFIDLDVEIERREGESVTALFGERGEAAFRDAEHAALAAIEAAEPSVIATGGGVVLREDNQALLKESGTVVYLAVTPEEAIARLGDADDRPLLAGGGLGAARSILSARLALYAATADHVVDTGGRSVRQVADAVIETLGGASAHDVVRVGAASDPAAYDVLIGPGLLDQVGSRVAAFTGAVQVALVADETVWRLMGSRVSRSLHDVGIHVSEHRVPAGEESKSWQRAGALLEGFAAAGLDRESAVVALGGGVIGDLAGFCAATYMRGVSLVHVPTTVLAQVDSAIGGKTAVDLAAGKNLAGAFWPPRLVLADTDSLGTLPDAEWTNGLAEVVKSALLAGGDFLERFERDLDRILSRDARAVRTMVCDAAAFKGSVVTADLRESGLRECLNLGHTLGHALEVIVGYGAVPHGIAVAEGMRFAAALAETAASAEPGLARRAEALLERVGAGRDATKALLQPYVLQLDPDTVISAMRSDKKSRAGVVRFVLLERPGAWRVQALDDATLRSALAQWAARLGEV